jgi:hypothetical protein
MNFRFRISEDAISFRDKTLLKPALHHKREHTDRITVGSYYKVHLPGRTAMSVQFDLKARSSGWHNWLHREEVFFQRKQPLR